MARWLTDARVPVEPPAGRSASLLPARFRSGRTAASAAVLAAALAGCAAPPPPPPPPPPTVVNVTLQTTADVNPGADGQGAPVALRLYQLASPANFAAAEFFPLYNDDAGTLKSDLVRREDFLLAPGLSAPGQARTETIMPNDQVKAIGVFAALRDFRRANWRGAADIPAHRTTNITVSAGRDGVTVKAETLPLPPPPKP